MPVSSLCFFAGKDQQGEISKALMEAWVWLEREGLIAPKPESQGNVVFVTGRGKRLKNASDTPRKKPGYANRYPGKRLSERIPNKKNAP